MADLFDVATRTCETIQHECIGLEVNSSYEVVTYDTPILPGWWLVHPDDAIAITYCPWCGAKLPEKTS